MKKLILTALVFFYFILSILPISAQDDSVKTVLYKQGNVFIGEVWLGDNLVIKLISPKEKFLNIKLTNTQKRLENAVSSGINASEIKPYKLKQGACIKASSEIIINIYNSETSVYNKSAYDLAKLWSANLKKAIGGEETPKVGLSSAKVVIPKGQTKIVWVKTKDKQQVEVSGFNEALIKVTASPGKIEITGLEDGQTIISVSYTSAKGDLVTKQIKVIIKEPAGVIPSEIFVKVTGTIAPLSLVKSAVLSDLRDKITTNPRTKTSIDWKGLKKLKALSSGQSCSTKFNVSIKGENYLPVKGAVKVTISNVGFSRRGADFIMISDRPENLYAEGEVFQGQIQNYSTHRFLYHHKNSNSGCKRVFTVRLINNSDEKSVVHITSPLNNPHYREITAGYLAGHNFLFSWLNGQGQIKEILPGKSAVVLSEEISPGYIASGLLAFQVLGGGLPKVAANVYNSKEGDYNNYRLNQTEEEKLIHPKGTFSGPDLNLDYKHILGGNFLFAQIGEEPFLKEIKTSEPCYGNYGVFYNLNITLENPSYQEKEAEIIFVPRSGPAKGIFVIDGDILETDNTAFSTQEVLLKKYVLSAGEKRKVKLLTFPLSGSHYPVNIVVRSVPEINNSR